MLSHLHISVSAALLALLVAACGSPSDQASPTEPAPLQQTDSPGAVTGSPTQSPSQPPDQRDTEPAPGLTEPPSGATEDRVLIEAGSDDDEVDTAATAAAEGELAEVDATPAGPTGCLATPDDGPGPNYVPGAPERAEIGAGYVLEGIVLAAGTCAPIESALVEIWMAGPDGVYTPAYRAVQPTDPDGRYRFETHFPPSYSSLSPHIHIRVSADGHAPVHVTHRPQAGSTGGEAAVVLAEE